MDEYGQRPDLPPTRYSMLNRGDTAHGGTLRPPKAPRREHSYRRRRTCCSCLLWCLCSLFLVAVVVAGCIAVFFALYTPKLPTFVVDGISVAALDVNASDLTLHAKMTATVNAANRNGNIEFVSRRGSRISVVYRQTQLCQGELPSFYVGYGNTTTVVAAMEGRRGFGAGIQEQLKVDHAAGRVPLTVYMRVPVTARIKGADAMEVVVNFAASTFVDNLSPDSKLDVNNKDSRYDTNFEL